MIENQSNKSRIIHAALELAKNNSWADITLIEIAREAQLTLADLSEIFHSKSDVLEGFSRAIDTEVLRSVSLDQDISVRDRLFDVMMTRFDVLSPYKPALIKIYGNYDGRSEGLASPLRRLLGSQYWMLVAAGVDQDGPRGVVKAAGLASIYSSVFVNWLGDSDPGQAKTMAMLDTKLRRGESWLKRAGFVRSGLKQLLKTLQQSAGRNGIKPSGTKGQDPDRSAAAQSQTGEPRCAKQIVRS